MSCNTQGKLAGSSKAAGPTGLELGSTPDTLTAFCSFTFGFNLMLAMGSKKGCLGSPAPRALGSGPSSTLAFGRAPTLLGWCSRLWFPHLFDTRTLDLLPDLLELIFSTGT